VKSNHNIIRDLLKQHPDGLKSSEIATLIGVSARSVNKSLESVFGVYIDRWENSTYRNTLAAIWVVVDVPDNCPKPNNMGRRTKLNSKD
jgi:Mn-dependent DtxR family transcriptional regulator